MDLTELDQTLALVLNDPNGATYTPALRARAESLAIRAYSRFIAYKRRFGTGSLYSQGNIGDTSILSVGGPFSNGSVITLDAGLPWQETFTVTSIARATSNAAPFVGVPLQLNLNAPLANLHPTPTTITQVNLGLTTVVGYDTYFMPYDFVDPDIDTWDIATGARRWVKRQESFYDGVYSQSQDIMGVSYGMSQNFQGAPGFGGAFLGASTGTSTPAIGGLNLGSPGFDYTFIEGNPTVLIISPVPTYANTLDFMYISSQSPDTIPDSDLDAVCDMAQSECYRFLSGVMAGKISYMEGFISEHANLNARELNALADAKQASFDIKVRQRPYATSG